MQKPYGRLERRAEARSAVGWRVQRGGFLRFTTGLVLAVTTAVLLGSCATAPATREDKTALVDAATARLREMQRADPTLSALLQRGYGYALFPQVDKGGLAVGGAYGQGVVYERGQHIGYCDLKQGSVGLQAGGQTFSELLVFETRAALERFKAGQGSFAADASAVILTSGVATKANFINGVAVVVHPLSGVMVEAAIGGQEFTYQAK